MVTSQERKALKKKMADQTSYMVVFVPKSGLFDFFLLIFLESYREIDTVQCKNPIIVTEKNTSERICELS